MKNNHLFRRTASILLFELPLFLLTVQKGKTGFFFSLLLFCIYCFFLIKKGKIINYDLFQIKYPVITLFILIITAALFYFRWSSSGRISIISNIINHPQKQTCIIVALVLALFSIPGVDYALKFFLEKFKKYKTTGYQKSYHKYIYLLITAFLTITLNSKCSLLYPFNNWTDPNFMMTVGKGVLKGLVPYRDLYEQKGPAILFFHSIAASISFRTFHGVWIIEIIFCFIYLFLQNKILSLYFRKNAIIINPMIAAVIYSCNPFLAGDSAEELCLPLLTYGLYAGCRSIKMNSYPSKKSYFLIGISIGLILWIKYSILSFYIGLTAFYLILIIKNKHFHELLYSIKWVICGILIISIPILCYFTYHSALWDLIDVYFIKNIMVYTDTTEGIIRNLQLGFLDLIQWNRTILITIGAGIAWMLIKKQWRTLSLIICTLLSTFIFTYIGGRYYGYYSFIFTAFTGFGFFWLVEITTKINTKKGIINNYRSFSSVFTLIISMIFLSFISNNMKFLEFQQRDLMPFKIKDIIEQSGIKDPSILEYKTLATGINTAAGLIPNTRFFCKFNIPLQEMFIEQDNYVANGIPDFIVMESYNEESFTEFERYTHLGVTRGDIRDNNRDYFYHYYIRK